MLPGKHIGYYRISTDRQGRSDLGLKARRAEQCAGSDPDEAALWAPVLPLPDDLDGMSSGYRFGFTSLYARLPSYAT